MLNSTCFSLLLKNAFHSIWNVCSVGSRIFDKSSLSLIECRYILFSKELHDIGGYYWLIGIQVYDFYNSGNHISLGKGGHFKGSLGEAFAEIRVYPHFHYSLGIDTNHILVDLERSHLLLQEVESLECLGIKVQDVGKRYFFNFA